MHGVAQSRIPSSDDDPMGDTHSVVLTEDKLGKNC